MSPVVPVPGRPGADPARRPVLLALRALGIGDLATVVPALRALRRGYPGHELVLATPPALAELARSTTAVDRVLPTRAYVRAPMGRLGWSGPPPEISVNLHGAGPQSHRALLAIRPGRLLGYACPAAGWRDGPRWTAERHEVLRWCELLAWYGIKADRADLVLPPPPPVPGWAGAVVVHPGASEPARRWPVDRFAAVARELAGAGRTVLISGSAEEAPAAREVAAAAGLPADAVVAGRTRLAELAALIAHAALVICGDTGVAHLATAYRTRSVLLFGPVPPGVWGPLLDLDRHTVLWRGPSGLAGIGVPEVISAAAGQLAAVPVAAGHRAGPR